MGYKRGELLPLSYYKDSSYNTSFTNSKTQCLQGFGFWLEFIRTFHGYNNELFYSNNKEKEVQFNGEQKDTSINS